MSDRFSLRPSKESDSARAIRLLKEKVQVHARRRGRDGRKKQRASYDWQGCPRFPASRRCDFKSDIDRYLAPTVSGSSNPLVASRSCENFRIGEENRGGIHGDRLSIIIRQDEWRGGRERLVARLYFESRSFICFFIFFFFYESRYSPREETKRRAIRR